MASENLYMRILTNTATSGLDKKMSYNTSKITMKWLRSLKLQMSCY